MELLDFPLEILNEIAFYLDIKTLSKCQLVSSKMHAVTLPAMYHSFDYGERANYPAERMSLLSQTLKDRPDLAKLVKFFNTGDSKPGTRALYSRVFDTLSVQLHSLTHLVIPAERIVNSRQTRKKILKMLKRIRAAETPLKYLRIKSLDIDWNRVAANLGDPEFKLDDMVCLSFVQQIDMPDTVLNVSHEECRPCIESLECRSLSHINSTRNLPCLTNLKRLRLGGCFGYPSTQTSSQMFSLKVVLSSTPSLESLELAWEPFTEDYSIDVLELEDALMQVCGTLRKLSLTIDHCGELIPEWTDADSQSMSKGMMTKFGSFTKLKLLRIPFMFIGNWKESPATQPSLDVTTFPPNIEQLQIYQDGLRNRKQKDQMFDHLCVFGYRNRCMGERLPRSYSEEFQLVGMEFNFKYRVPVPPHF